MRVLVFDECSSVQFMELIWPPLLHNFKSFSSLSSARSSYTTYILQRKDPDLSSLYNSTPPQIQGPHQTYYLITLGLLMSKGVVVIPCSSHIWTNLVEIMLYCSRSNWWGRMVGAIPTSSSNRSAKSLLCGNNSL